MQFDVLLRQVVVLLIEQGGFHVKFFVQSLLSTFILLCVSVEVLRTWSHRCRWMHTFNHCLHRIKLHFYMLATIMLNWIFGKIMA